MDSATMLLVTEPEALSDQFRSLFPRTVGEACSASLGGQGLQVQLREADSAERALELAGAASRERAPACCAFIELGPDCSVDGLGLARTLADCDRDLRFTFLVRDDGWGLLPAVERAFSGQPDRWDVLHVPCTDNELLQKARRMAAAWTHQVNVRRRMEHLERQLKVLAERGGQLKATERSLSAEPMALVGQVFRSGIRETADALEPLQDGLTKIDSHLEGLVECEPELASVGSVDTGRESGHGSVLIQATAAVDRASSAAQDLERLVAPWQTLLEPAGQLGAVDLNAGLRAAVAVIAPRLRGRAIVTVDLEEVPPFLGDSGALSGAWLHLLKNAAEAVEHCDGRAALSVSSRTDGECVRVVIRDEGCGMSQSVTSRAFEAGRSGWPDVAEHLGAGLSAVREIVQAHSGSVSIASQPGAGTQVTIAIPTSSTSS